MVYPKLCTDCRKQWKNSLTKKELRKIRLSIKNEGRKLRSFYPFWVYHKEPTVKCIRHHSIRLADGAKRRAKKMDATPKWVDTAALKRIYRNAKEIERMTGKQMHVDHIVPLRSKVVCGLHVPWNLRIITRHENAKKKNTLLVDSHLIKSAHN